ncbi:formate dehydrogenase accessory sulfurtransferase FdhD [Pelagicoccus sp. SDUM812002]|uniref:formate dehydrogenase accessory sulfurtransferase FdhD n=1 Tax=Pelagicoccus sp. SDUM812002 TaxID=3041266 RepID=UPI002810804D|nr:formate dehydrogenase accessory sulfurtransferase FdhD [Pelagicoccus sp. SDUM812002]MDQ8184387.1 formate dehydrogenase accessory sulfurtransferase FdhD [Pelagicoccus sp. SDUM812002]
MPKNDISAKGTATVRSRILRIAEGKASPEDDRLTVEEPLEVAVRNSKTTLPLGVAFRTPGDDEALVLGMLYNEGIITSATEVVDIRFTQAKGATMPAWRAMVRVTESATLEEGRHSRAFPISSACGACGKSALESLRIAREDRFHDREGVRLSEEAVKALPLKLLQLQSDFQRTGGLHAAARIGADGGLIALAEDIGRHNAMDKLTGAWLRGDSLPWEEQAILFSGRLGYDLMQKALACGCPFLVSIGAPSSFAVELANLFNVTLVGFLRGERFNVYSAPYRIHFSD